MNPTNESIGRAFREKHSLSIEHHAGARAFVDAVWKRARELDREQSANNRQAMVERVAQLIAHRACHSEEHDPQSGRIHGYCVVCGTPWPCEIAAPQPPAQERGDAGRLRHGLLLNNALTEELRALRVDYDPADTSVGIMADCWHPSTSDLTMALGAAMSRVHPGTRPAVPAQGRAVGEIGFLGGNTIVLYSQEEIGHLPKGTLLYTRPAVPEDVARDADSTLLDWMLAEGCVVETDGNRGWRVRWDWLPEAGRYGPYAATKRDAIRAAIASQAEEGGNG